MRENAQSPQHNSCVLVPNILNLNFPYNNPANIQTIRQYLHEILPTWELNYPDLDIEGFLFTSLHYTTNSAGSNLLP